MLPSANPQLLPGVPANPVALVLQPQAFLSFQTLQALPLKLLCASELPGGGVFKMQIPRVTPKDSDYREIGGGAQDSVFLANPELF